MNEETWQEKLAKARELRETDTEVAIDYLIEVVEEIGLQVLPREADE